MGEDKDSPSFATWVGLDDFFKPFQLFLVDGNFVTGVLGIAENRTGHAYQERLVGNLTDELRSRLTVRPQEHLQVG